MVPASVRVFSVELDQPADVVARLADTLPGAERDARPRVQVARGALRLLLGRELGVAPSDVAISRRCEHCGHPSHGRPTLTAGEVSFSLSHSDGVALVALGPGTLRLGVDVEVVRPRPRLDALARRVLGVEEWEEWTAIDDADARLRAFLRAWTAKEAYLKAVGIGIATRLRDVYVPPGGWSAVAVDLGDRCVATVAADLAPVTVEQAALSSLALPSGGTAG